MRKERLVNQRAGNEDTAGKREDKEITVIGNAIIDVLAAGVNLDRLRVGSQSADEIKTGFGGDGLNEATVLARFGKNVEIITKIGEDEAGGRILEHLHKNGILFPNTRPDSAVQTSVNIVLVDKQAERYFITNPQGSQRRLSAEDILPYIDEMAPIVCFASIFISEALDIRTMRDLFREIKKTGRLLVADCTKPKHGERLEDMKELLTFLDFLIPNEAEAELMTGEKDPALSAQKIVEAGARCAIIKCGANGCIVCDGNVIERIPAFSDTKCVDTTGAGDSFAAGFVYGISSGMSVLESSRLGCATASCAIERTGATDAVTSIDEPWERYLRMSAGTDGTVSYGCHRKIKEKR